MLEEQKDNQDTSTKSGGWGAFSAFKKSKRVSVTGFTPAHVIAKKDFSPITKLLIFLIPMLLFATFYQYSSVLGSTFLNLTLRSNINLENGLIGHWTFDGADVTDKVYDMSGEGNHGGLYGGATTSAKASGRVGQGLSFDGIDDRILLPSVPSLKPDQWTISVWAYALSGSGTYRGIFFPSYSDGYNSGFLLLISNEGRAAIRYGNGAAPVGSIFSNVSILGQWHHIIGTFDGTNMVLYIDGVIEDTTDASTFAYGVTPVQSQIGDGNVTDSFDGKLDDVRFYNRALSAREVEALYKQGEGSKVSITPQTTSSLENGLVAHWTFDGPDVTDKVYDITDEGNHGGFLGGATSSAKVSGKVGQGLYFDSVNDYIQVPHDASLSLTSQTLCSWIRPRAAGSQIIIDKRGANSETGYNLRLEGSVSPLDVEYILKDRSGINETGDTEETLTRVIDAIVVGSWSHLCASFDDTSNAVAVYVNGNVATTSSSLRDLSNTPTTYPLRIGDWSGYGLGVPGSTNFNGSIDDVRIYNRALSADEVQQIYQIGVGTTIDAVPL